MAESPFSVDFLFFLTVVAMTGATYLMRAAGYWIMGQVPLTPRIRRGLEALPGAIIVSTILPIALKGGVPAALCLMVAAAVMAVLRKDIVAVVLAIAAAAGARALGL
ncbi:branched-chain amino acid ABC transporter [Pannonibacter phragmitetus]|uniref:Branched-chain amino acid ABC transporter n=1 Tax=Pannonibacter phragmitetus TaxID=121719 RepID=A0A0L0J3E0_9HYPH|nr:AzlD domain-containing protein [Pannonibacter phragmitetus]ALV25997.1 branched-chain amino acid ABC transporter [Pannonibacter phragmitetus]KND20118.1 branched-chain amino acid ABC transporter [Pannonibacter phragmitetus]MBA4205248.1 branched-chain amino acid ABC transporter [Polymorphum sp.]